MREGRSYSSRVGRQNRFTRATISGLLDGLERDGLIERCPDPEDRRLIRVNLTDAGQSFLDKIRPGYCRWFTSIVEPLDEDERQQLVFLLEKIRTRLSELAQVREVQSA